MAGEGYVQIGKGFYLDLASLPTFFDEEYPSPMAQKHVEIALKTLDAEHLLWGSDIPGTLTKVTYRQALDLVREHCTFLSSSEERLILSEKAIFHQLERRVQSYIFLCILAYHLLVAIEKTLSETRNGQQLHEGGVQVERMKNAVGLKTLKI